MKEKEKEINKKKEKERKKEKNVIFGLIFTEHLSYENLVFRRRPSVG